MAIYSLNYGDRAAWDEYVVNSSNSTCYHLSGWKMVVERSFGHETHYLLSEKQGRINGVLPLVHMSSLLFGNFLISLPYFNYGGVCAENEVIAGSLLDEAVRIALEKKVTHVELRHTKQMTQGLAEKTGKVSMRLPLPCEATDLWTSFPAKLRSQIRKPMKDEMYVRFGANNEVDGFYKVFSINMRDLGTPVYSKDFFINILNEFPASTWICTVYTKQGEPVASGFLVGFKDTLEIPWASSLRNYNNSSPNMLLYWSALEFACKQGYRFFDFGRSTPEEGTYKFKEQWGAKPIQLYWHYWLKNGETLPELNPKNPKYQAAIKVWRKLPLSLTRLIGPAIVKDLP